MKVLVAHRAGLTKVILPKRNMRDLDEFPDEVLNQMTFIPVEQIDKALKVALLQRKIKMAIPKAVNNVLAASSSFSSGHLD